MRRSRRSEIKSGRRHQRGRIRRKPVVRRRHHPDAVLVAVARGLERRRRFVVDHRRLLGAPPIVGESAAAIVPGGQPGRPTPDLHATSLVFPIRVRAFAQLAVVVPPPGVGAFLFRKLHVAVNGVRRTSSPADKSKPPLTTTQ